MAWETTDAFEGDTHDPFTIFHLQHENLKEFPDTLKEIIFLIYSGWRKHVILGWVRHDKETHSEKPSPVATCCHNVHPLGEVRWSDVECCPPQYTARTSRGVGFKHFPKLWGDLQKCIVFFNFSTNWHLDEIIMTSLCLAAFSEQIRLWHASKAPGWPPTRRGWNCKMSSVKII